MERKVREKFQYNGHVLTIVESKTCKGYFFFDIYCRAIKEPVNTTVGR